MRCCSGCRLHQRPAQSSHTHSHRDTERHRAVRCLCTFPSQSVCQPSALNYISHQKSCQMQFCVLHLCSTVDAVASLNLKCMWVGGGGRGGCVQGVIAEGERNVPISQHCHILPKKEKKRETCLPQIRSLLDYCDTKTTSYPINSKHSKTDVQLLV